MCRQLLLSNFLAQTEALMKGKSSAEAKAELEKSGMSGAELQKILPHKVIDPSSSLLYFARVVDDVRCILVMAVCLSVPRRFPALLHGPGYNLGNGRGAPLVVHYCAGLQSMHGFCCYNNIAPNAKCHRLLVLALCLVSCIVRTDIKYV